MKKPTSRRVDPSIVIHKAGVMTHAPSARLQPNKRGTKRGTIREWSAHSRLRLRRFMLTHEPATKSMEANVTLTIPGPPPAVDEIKTLWKYFSREIQRLGFSAVWRMEVQARGSVHWHMILTIPMAGVVPAEWCEHWMTITDLWTKSLKQLGPVDHQCKINGRESIYSFQSRADIPGADQYASHIQFDHKQDGDRWAWRRYMQDHASKSKQEQIAEGFGRHWGVIGRRGYVCVVPQSVESVTDPEYFRVVRWLQRLTTGTVRCDKAVFGRKRGKRNKRGKHGRSVWFSNPATVQRLVECARCMSDPVAS